MKKRFFACALSIVPLMIGASQPVDLLMGIQVDVKFPSKISIDDHKQRIQKELHKNGIVRTVLGTGAGIGMGLGVLAVCYFVYTNYKIVNVTELNNQMAHYLAVICSMTNQLKEKASEDVMAQIPAIQDAVKEQFARQTGQTWGDWGKNFVVFIGQSLALGYVQNMIANDLFYDVNVEWFSTRRTAMMAVYEELQTLQLDIKELQAGMIYISQYQSDRYANGMIRLSNAMITELETIIGYLNAQAERLGLMACDTHGDLFLGNYLEKRADMHAQKMHELSELYKQHTTNDERMKTLIALFTEIKGLSLEINSSLSGFNRFELQKQAAY